MKKLLFASIISLLIVSSCNKGGKNTDDSENFKMMSDTEKVHYLMSRVTPDSLARFIIYNSLDNTNENHIDTMAIATSYVYERLKENDLETFQVAYDSTIESLPLESRMKIYKMAGSDDPQGLGYKLGLEYMSEIRNGHKSSAEIEKEIKAFKKACADDQDTFNRFIIGFQTVLKLDHGKDVPEDIYKKFLTADPASI